MTLQFYNTRTVMQVSRLIQKLHFHVCSALLSSSTDSDVTAPAQQPGEALLECKNFKTRSMMEPPEVLVQSLCHNDSVGIMNLNPEVFSQFPLLHVIHSNVVWQQKYRYVNYKHALTRAECPGGGRKPWPQKGLGRARHGSVRSPIFLRGGIAHGPRCYTTKFYMLPFRARVLGLTSTFSVKLAQGDLKVVDSLTLPSSDPQYLEQLVDDRLWGPSVLFADVDDVMPENITIATDSVGHFNLMPVYGLNVYSMLKHTTLVLTVTAVRRIEERIMLSIYNTQDAFVDDEFRAKTFGL